MESTPKDKTMLQKAVNWISILLNLSIVVLGALQLLQIWNEASNVFVPLMGVSMLCQAYKHWHSYRKLAFFSIGAAVFVFICTIVVFFIK